MTPNLNLAELEKMNGLPAGLLTAVMQTESAGNPNAVSPVGAQGLFQFMPATAKQYGIDPFDPQQAAGGAARMYSDLLRKYGGDLPSALAAYNWGQGNVDRKGLENAPPETRNYISKITGMLGQPQPETSSMTAERVMPGPGYAANISLEDIDAELASRQQQPAQQDTAVPEGITLEDIDAELASREAEKPRQKTHLGQALIDTGLQGLSFGTSDEIGSFLQGLMTGKPYETLVNQERQRIAAEREDYPVSTAIADIGGSLALPGVGLAKLAGSAPRVVSALRTLAKARPLTTAAAGGAVGGGARGFGEGTDAASRASGAVFGAGMGAGLGAGGAAIAPKLAGALSRSNRIANSTPITNSVSEEIRLGANKLYQEADAKGGLLTPQFTDKFIADVKSVMPQTPAGKVVAGENAVSKVVSRLDELKGKPLTLQEAQEIDEALSDQIDNFVELGRLNKEGKKLSDIQQKFRDAIEKAGPGDVQGNKEGFEALKQGRAEWRRYMKAREIERIMERGLNKDQPATSIRSGFRQLLDNPNKIRGYTTPEKALIKKAATAGLGQEVLRTIGSRLLGIVSLGAANPVGAILSQGASAAARAGAAKVQLSKGAKVIDEIAGKKASKAVTRRKATTAPISGATGGSVGGQQQRKDIPRIEINKKAKE